MKNKIVESGKSYMVHIRTYSVILLASASEPSLPATPTPDHIGTLAYAPALVLPTTLPDVTTLVLTIAPFVSTPALPSYFR